MERISKPLAIREGLMELTPSIEEWSYAQEMFFKFVNSIPLETTECVGTYCISMRKCSKDEVEKALSKICSVAGKETLAMLQGLAEKVFNKPFMW